MTDAVRKRILCIDDDRDVIETYQAILGNAGYDVVVAFDGDAGLEEARRAKPDLIILDVMMRDMTEGFHVSYDVRKDDTLRDVPILMLTSVGDEMNQRFARTRGGPYLPVDVFVAKPVAPDTLLDTVRYLLAIPQADIAACWS
jgi:DNA-binding response OmpR family regulator